MTAEIFKLAMPGRFFVFTATQNAERLSAFGRALQSLGAVVAGPQAFSLGKDSASPEAIRDALGDLEEGECVYIIGAAGEALENYLIAAPRTEGGITLR
jgi:hypothetical protein